MQAEFTVQVDFADNYVCHYFEDLHDNEQASVHPAVIHYKAATAFSCTIRKNYHK